MYFACWVFFQYIDLFLLYKFQFNRCNLQNHHDLITFPFLFRKMLHRHPFFHTSLYTPCIRKRKEERKEKVCLFGIHISTCQIFVWVSKGVLSPKGVYVSLLFCLSSNFFNKEDMLQMLKLLKIDWLVHHHKVKSWKHSDSWLHCSRVSNSLQHFTFLGI